MTEKTQRMEQVLDFLRNVRKKLPIPNQEPTYKKDPNNRQLKSMIKIVDGAIDLLKCKKHWTKQVQARDKDGRAVDVTSREAICFCMQGALIKSKHKQRLARNYIGVPVPLHI